MGCWVVLATIPRLPGPGVASCSALGLSATRTEGSGSRRCVANSLLLLPSPEGEGRWGVGVRSSRLRTGRQDPVPFLHTSAQVLGPGQCLCTLPPRALPATPRPPKTPQSCSPHLCPERLPSPPCGLQWAVWGCESTQAHRPAGLGCHVRERAAGCAWTGGPGQKPGYALPRAGWLHGCPDGSAGFCASLDSCQPGPHAWVDSRKMLFTRTHCPSGEGLDTLSRPAARVSRCMFNGDAAIGVSVGVAGSHTPAHPFGI